MSNNEYKVYERARAEKKRWKPALAVVTSGVLAIAGVKDNSVSFYDIQSNTWRSNL